MSYLAHPGFILIILSLFISIVKKRTKFLAISAVVISIISLINIYFNNASMPQLLYFTIDNISALIAFSFLFILTITFFFNNDNLDTQLSLIYIGCSITIVLSKHLIIVFLAFELMMIIGSLFIINGHSQHAKKIALNYFRTHILSGTLLLIGIIIKIYKAQTLLIAAPINTNLDIAQLFILSGLLINVALPPFSYWLTEGYPSASPIGSIILSICMTKVSALLILKLFPGMSHLIYIGIFMSIYGIIYMALETNIRKIVSFSIICEIGLILIAVGLSSIEVATSLIISNIFYASLLMASTSSIVLLTKQEYYFQIAKSKNRNIIFIIYLATLLSVSSFPFTPGYINKYYLSLATSKTNYHWVVYFLNTINCGIIIALCCKIIDFMFFYQKHHIKNTYKAPKHTYKICNYTLLTLLIGGILICYAACFILNMSITIDYKIVTQSTIFIISIILFRLIRKYLFIQSKTQLLELDIIFIPLVLIFSKIRNVTAFIINSINNNKTKYIKTLQIITSKFLGPRGYFVYSENLGRLVIIIVLILILFLINI